MAEKKRKPPHFIARVGRLCLQVGKAEEAIGQEANLHNARKVATIHPEA